MIVLFLGAVIGVIFGGLIFIYVMKKNMLVCYRIEGSFSEVEEAIKEIVPSFEGWSFPISDWQFFKSQASKGLSYDNIKNMVMHFVCKPSHANKVLRVNPVLGGIMPCTWSVYETKDGKVYIAKMNIALMGKMYSGVIGKVMKEVAETEAKILAKIKYALKEKANK